MAYNIYRNIQLEVQEMKLLKVTASGFKNCRDDFTVDLVAKSKKTSEDKEYELMEIAEELYVFNTAAFVGKNASGKTTAIELLDCCYSLLGDFRLEDKHYSFENIGLEMFFYHKGYIYRYLTKTRANSALDSHAAFYDQHLYRKKYFKSNSKKVYDLKDFTEMTELTELPEDISILFFALKKKTARALYFDSFGEGVDTYRLLFRTMKTYGITADAFASIVKIFDSSIKGIERIDDHNYSLQYRDCEQVVSDKELLYLLSSGTTKGVLLYVMMTASLQNGFDLIIDEIENHFHKSLVENMISLYKDKQVNRHHATLCFTTHYCEILDLLNRQDSIWICKADEKVYLENMYDSYDIRAELLKSRQFYNNAFDTAVNYDDLMRLKKELMR